MLLFVLLFLLMPLIQGSNVPPRGILNQKAPAWQVSEWFQLPLYKKSLDRKDFQGKVVYLYCFQSWCPGCHSHGFPTLQEVIKKYKDDSDVAIVAVQTTFEGFSYNSFRQAKEIAKKYYLDIPIGQSGRKGEYSKLMINYRTGGTPWTIIIDKEGIVRYNDFHIDSKVAIKLIADLKIERKN